MPKLVNGAEVYVIGLCGKARSGKDTAAGFLREALPGYCSVLSMAAPLKNMMRELLFAACPWSRSQSVDVLARLFGDTKEEVHPVLGKSTREMLQTLGTEWGRGMIADDVWIRLMENRIALEAYDVAVDGYAGDRAEPRRLYVIIPDIRYDNEAALCDLIIKIRRDDAPEVAAHASEHGINPELIKAEVVNNGTKDDLRKRMIAVLHQHGLGVGRDEPASHAA